MIKPSNKGIRFNPNSFHKATMSPVDLSKCVQKWCIDAIECPMYDALVYPEECQNCDHGLAGDYKLKWVKCDYWSRSRKLDSEFGNWVDI